ncbi:MAG: MFS transporter, partial [Ferrovibrionaceae bacterium]
ILMGLCLGPIQAASRTMVGRLAPPGKIAEFYGLFSLSGRATAFLAPFAIAVVTQAFDSQRAGMSVVLVFLVVGLLLMLRVEEPAR